MSGRQDPRVVNFAVPTALDTPVIGTDQETGLSFFTALDVNMILRMIEDLAETSTIQYVYDFIRDSKVVRTIPGNLMKSELPGPVWLPFPITVAPGMFLIQMRQLTGTLAARKVTIIYDHALGG